MQLANLPNMELEMMLLLDHKVTNFSSAQWRQYHEGLVQLRERYAQEIKKFSHTYHMQVNAVVGLRVMHDPLADECAASGPSSEPSSSGEAPQRQPTSSQGAAT